MKLYAIKTYSRGGREVELLKEAGVDDVSRWLSERGRMMIPLPDIKAITLKKGENYGEKNNDRQG